MIPQTLDLIYNLALLVAISMVSGFLRRRQLSRTGGALLQGLLFGSAAIIGMVRPLILGPGLIFDGRSVVICLCSLFFGPIAALTAGGMAALYRCALGGAGLTMGLLVITEATLFGLGWRRWLRGRRREPSIWDLLGLGMAVHGVMLLLLATLPAGSGMPTLWHIGLPVLVLFPLTTLMVGEVLQGQEAEFRTRIALEVSEDHFRSLAESSPDGIVRLDRQRRLTYLNPMAIRTFGQPASALLQRTHWEFGCPADVCRLWDDQFTQVLETATPAQAAFAWPGPDGVLYFDLRLTPELDAQGQVASVLGVFRDFTQLRESEAEVRKIRAAVEHCPVGVVITDTTGQIEYVNPKFTDITEYPSAEILGQNLQVFRTGASPSDAEQERRTILAGGAWQGEYHNRKKGGTAYWEQTSIAPILDAQGHISHFVAVKEDITERKRTEAMLIEREAQHRALLAAIPDLIFINRRDGQFLAVHASSPDLLLLEPEAFLSRKVPEVLPQALADRIMAGFALALDLKTPQELHYTLTLKGEDRAYEARIVPYGEDAVISMIRDVTERRHAEDEQRRLQAQLAQAHKLESLGSLAGGVAHDMNNVLGAILALASAQEVNASLAPSTRETFKVIIRAAQRGGAMVKRLLGFARQTPAVTTDLDLNELLGDVIRLLERTTLARIRFQPEFSPRPSLIRGDASALSHAFMNLCVNAADAMPEGGTLTLRTLAAGAGFLGVELQDTGTGMSPEVLERACDPFFTTKAQGKGTGLGLALVYTTVKAHQGHLELRSEPGAGTCVRVRFPALTQAGQPQAATGALPAGPGPRSLDVLLVDDDELVRVSVTLLLETLGHTVTAAPCGEEALAHLETGARPDLAIIDMNMPGLGGAGTLPLLRQLAPALPVLLATGRVDQKAMDLLAGFAHVTLLAKPFSLEEVRKQLDLVIRRPPGGDPGA